MSDARVGGEAPADLQVKYDELVQYTLMLEKQKKKLEDRERASTRCGRGKVWRRETFFTCFEARLEWKGVEVWCQAEIVELKGSKLSSAESRGPGKAFYTQIEAEED